MIFLEFFLFVIYRKNYEKSIDKSAKIFNFSAFIFFSAYSKLYRKNIKGGNMLKKTVVATKKTKNKRKLRKLKINIILLILALVILLFTLDYKMQPILWSIIEYESNKYAQEAFQKAAITHVQEQSQQYEMLYTVTKDVEHNTATVIADSYAINKIQTQLTQMVMLELTNLQKDFYSFPLGYLLGIQLLSDIGPMIEVQVQPNSYVQTKLHETFVSAGNNQTKMSIYARFSLYVNVMVAGQTKTMLVVNDVLLWQNIIVGAVPDVNV